MIARTSRKNPKKKNPAAAKKIKSTWGYKQTFGFGNHRDFRCVFCFFFYLQDCCRVARLIPRIKFTTTEMLSINAANSLGTSAGS